MDDREWAVFCYRNDLQDGPMVEEIALHRAGFEAVGTYLGEELFEDPEDRADDGGVWIGRAEAMRRIRVRVLQARAGLRPPPGWETEGGTEDA